MLFSFVIWDLKPELISLGSFEVRWYGLLFALAFIAGQYFMTRAYTWEGLNPLKVENLTLWIALATVLGARLGHCLFYEPEWYLNHPIDILKIWEGGLASHGAGFAIFTATWFYSKRYTDQPYLWLLDRMSITVAMGGAFIRFGNLMNSEIIGKPTDLPWAFIFTSVDNVPRHPSQLYESISCVFLTILLFAIYYRLKAKTPEGLLFGIFLSVCFGLRFIYEFTKENQVDFENQLSFNMGQLLSIPLLTTGLVLTIRALYFNKNEVKKDING